MCRQRVKNGDGVSQCECKGAVRRDACDRRARRPSRGPVSARVPDRASAAQARALRPHRRPRTAARPSLATTPATQQILYNLLII